MSRDEWDVEFNLLDRQIIDCEDRLVAKVDDLELNERFDRRLEVTAILIGPGVLGPRLGGRLGEWTAAIWRRLHPDADPAPGRIGVEEITSIDNAVHVGATRLELDVEGFEVWADEKVVSRLPFVHGDGPADRPRGRDRFELPPLGTQRRMSQLLGQAVHTRSGVHLGTVSDARVRFTPGANEMAVESLMVNDRAMRSRFGYERPVDHHPWPVRMLLRATDSPASGRIDWADVTEVDWDARRVVLGVDALLPF